MDILKNGKRTNIDQNGGIIRNEKYQKVLSADRRFSIVN